MEEVVFVKNYMLKHHYKSVIFISDPPHSRCILFLANFVNNYNEANLSAIVVGSEVEWWDRSHYYQNNIARSFVKSELIKIVHNFIAYGVLQKFGLLEAAKDNFGSIIDFFRGEVYRNFIGTEHQ